MEPTSGGSSNRARSNSVSPSFQNSSNEHLSRRNTLAPHGEEYTTAAGDYSGGNAGSGAGAKVRRERTPSPSKYRLSDDDYGAGPLLSRRRSMEMEDMSDIGGNTDDEETGLSQSARKKRRQRKLDNMALDARVTGAGAGADLGMMLPRSKEEEKRLADKAVLRDSLINVVLIGLWYIFSLTISIYNKWMFDKKHLDFHFPLFTTCAHMLVQFSLASLVLYFLPRFRPGAVVEDRGEEDLSRSKKPLMTPFFYLTRIGPCGAATGLDIGLGNTSLKFISLTFFTMCKSSSLAFVLLFAFVFRLESPSVRLILIIATMTGGVVMMVFGETAFKLEGFILVILSSFFSGFRWALTQILLLRNPATSNPFASIFFLAPIMFLTLFIIAIPVEKFPALGAGLKLLMEEKGSLFGVLLLLFPGVIAFCMTSAEFALLQRTSVVTLSICGIFKEVVTITAAELTYHDPLTPINISGLLVTIVAIAAYNYMKIKKMRENAREEFKGGGTGEAEDGALSAEERQGMLANDEGRDRRG